MSHDANGTIFNIQRFSIHDGPGIRDLIFLKGCPLKCAWCANPESQRYETELSYRSSLCISCHACVNACPQKAITIAESGNMVIDRTACTTCFKCTSVCCSGALQQVGENISALKLYQRVTKMHKSWRSEAGITISGGEPLSQSNFVAKLLSYFKSAGIHTTMETCGYAPFKALKEVAANCDLIFFDLKCFDTSTHKKLTGVSNEQILENLLLLAKHFPRLPVIVRTPLIPGLNDSPKDLSSIANFLKQIKSLKDYELLPYHNWGANKYRQLGRPYLLENLPLPDKAAITTLNEQLRNQIRS